MKNIKHPNIYSYECVYYDDCFGAYFTNCSINPIKSTHNIFFFFFKEKREKYTPDFRCKFFMNFFFFVHLFFIVPLLFFCKFRGCFMCVFFFLLIIISVQAQIRTVLECFLNISLIQIFRLLHARHGMLMKVGNEPKLKLHFESYYFK